MHKYLLHVSNEHITFIAENIKKMQMIDVCSMFMHKNFAALHASCEF